MLKTTSLNSYLIDFLNLSHSQINIIASYLVRLVFASDSLREKYMFEKIGKGGNFDLISFLKQFFYQITFRWCLLSQFYYNW